MFPICHGILGSREASSSNGWDEPFSDSGFVLFSDALATRSGGTNGASSGCRSAASSSSNTDLIYFELQNVLFGAYAYQLRFGCIADTHTDDETLPVFDDGVLVPNNNFNTYSDGDTWMIAVDRTTGELWKGTNGVWTGDPAAGTESFAYRDVFLTSTPVRAYFDLRYPGHAGTLAVSAADFNYAPPAGFVGLGDL